VTELDLVCGEGRRVPGWQWLAWDTAERDAVRAELRVNLAARVDAAGRVAAGPVAEFTRVDERSGVVTLVAEVRVR
jgi:hypothetical protein